MKDPQKFIRQNKDVYNRIASLFSKTRDYVWDDLKVLGKYTKDGDVVLDLGCGNGRLYQLFAENQAEPGDEALSDRRKISYIGADQSEELIKIASEKFPEAKFVVAEMTDLPFADESFDGVYCIAALYHIPGRENHLKALSEMKRVLKPGGYLLLTNWNLLSDSAQAKIDKAKWRLAGSRKEIMAPWLTPEGEVLGERYCYGFELEELEELFEEVGFEIIDQYYARKTERVNQAEGHNIVSVVQKPHATQDLPG